MQKIAQWVLLAGGLLVLMASGEANAQKEPQGASNHQLVQAIHVLHSVNATLASANHDYGGHRAKAIADVSKAEKQLHLALQFAKANPGGKDKGKGKGKDKGTGKGKGKGKGEPQGISNAQLKDAIPVLKKTVNYLKKANHDYGGHRAAAIHDTEQAIHQLRVALKFANGKGKG